ncbi:hypothetical protein OUZ56_033546 [Daphnia magna]|uniref:Uncharacterized protein n=1 Tax=Daphnia magna TaxID=35525 RepID=A0ABQ9ZYU9_9CRUS|nr:hypothetical protein OUZ56_033540 [Daphnia magna]KAK4017769.1 hypothetical protein OUZ56_033546 [Daphnia magna]
MGVNWDTTEDLRTFQMQNDFVLRISQLGHYSREQRSIHHLLTMALCPTFTIFIGGANRCWKCKHEVEEILSKFG